jgi:hypothetical protein
MRREVELLDYTTQAEIYSQGWMLHSKRSKQPFGGFYFVFLRAFLQEAGNGVLLYE